MSTAPGPHPSPEELDALLDGPSGEPGDGSVAEHVAACEECLAVTDALAEVRSLLREEALRPPPPPAGLGARLDGALARASAERAGTVVPLRGADGDGSSRARRPRQVPRWLAVAAGVVVLGGAAVTATQVLGQGGDAQTSTAGAAVDNGADAGGESAGGSRAGTEAVASGTDYTRTDLAAQVAALVSGEPVPGEQATGGQATGGQGTGGQGTGGLAGPLAPEATQDAEGPESAPQSGALPGADEPLAGPAGLQGCLDAIGASGQTPLAVDLARFEGGDAAVIVLPDGSGDRVQVWVVARDCRPGADGLLEYSVVPLG